MSQDWESGVWEVDLAWGRRGARDAAARGDVMVVVDVLSFSTAVATAVAHGGAVYPCGKQDDVTAIAQSVGAAVAVHRRNAVAGQFSLSPLSFCSMQPGQRVVLPSPNGSVCSHYGRHIPALFAGALVNAAATASAAMIECAKHRQRLTIICAGERWEDDFEQEGMRVAIEDYLGAGSIISQIAAPKSPEAILCELAFSASRETLSELLHGCCSGRELTERGFRGDVDHAQQLDCYPVAAVLSNGCFVPWAA
ncbi:MAG: 2-phosphosulfolactate phosphatase [Armatimonadetes bacterium]|nr:2-phosphosulfolactate phosphatase [Armatimonadota bacterium]